MKIAFVLFDGFSAFDFASLYEPLTRLKMLGISPDLSWDLCANQKNVKNWQGMSFQPTRVAQPLEGYDLVVIPGVRDAAIVTTDEELLNWLLTAGSTAWLAAVGSSSLLLAAAGLLKGKRVAAQEHLAPLLAEYGALPVLEEIVEEDAIFTAAESGSALRLGLLLCAQLAGLGAAQQVQNALGVKPSSIISRDGRVSGDGISAAVSTVDTAGGFAYGTRFARVVRRTNETNIEIELDLDGSGQYSIETGLPFLDHLLAQVAVHGLFDLNIKAEGDLHVDPHHTVEDVALCLGDAFSQALGDRQGIVRMASTACPMDETLVWTVIDFSGRPYAVIQAIWTSPEAGGIATTLFAHFLESFATRASCNLHAQVMYGRDDHHKAEALFKSLGRALDTATQIDERRSLGIPSTKGVLS